MAKKPRTPPPPRRVQAPKQRHAARQGLDPARQRLILYGVAAAGIIGLVVVLIVLFAGGKSSGDVGGSTDQDVAAAMRAAGCTFKSVPPLPPKQRVPSGFHLDVPKLDSKVKWATFPPSAGSHYPLWAVWGFYRDAVNPRQVVHNEEHGGVIIWWGPKVPASTVDKLQAFYNESPLGMLGTPIAGLGNKIALTAWTGDPARYYQDDYYGIGKISTCTRFDEKAFTTFRDAYRGHGPEGVPLSQDAPGTGP